MVAERFEHTAHDAVAPRVNLYAGLVTVGLSRIADRIGVDRPVFELNAVGDTLHVVLRDILVTPYMVNLLFHISGMGEFRGKVAVVGQEKHPGRVTVETSHGIYAFVARSLDEIHHCRTAIGVIACSDAVFRLVKQDVTFAFERYNLFIILNNVAVADLCSELSDYLTVDLHKTLLDKFIGLTAGTNSGIAHKFIESYLLVGIGYRHFILYTLWARSEALASSRESSIVILVVIAAVLVVIAALTVRVVVAALAVRVVVAALAVRVVVAALTVRVVIAALAVRVVVAALAVLVVVAALTVRVVIAALAVLVIVAALAIGVIVASLAVRVVVSALAVIVVVIAWLICSRLSCLAISAFSCLTRSQTFVTRIIGSWTGLIVLTVVIASVIVVTPLTVRVVVVVARLVRALITRSFS